LIFIEKVLSGHTRTHYIGVANCVFDEAHEAGIHLDRSSCSVIHNTVSISPKQVRECSSELPCDYLVMPARVCDAKDHVKIAMAFDLSDYQGKLIFAGGGTKDKLFKDNISRCMKFKFSKVIFLGERSDIFSIIKNSDGVVLCSHYETFPLTIVEAFALGKPIIASNVGGNSEIIIHEENGLLADSLDEWIICLSKLNESAVRTFLSRNATETYEQKLSVRVNIDSLERIYLMYNSKVSNTSKV
jgi:glycosyltransferase involved in cell wall biosynthesis